MDVAPLNGEVVVEVIVFFVSADQVLRLRQEGRLVRRLQMFLTSTASYMGLGGEEGTSERRNGTTIR